MDAKDAMARALALAWQGWGRTGRNPMVGAVVLQGGRVVAEASHAAFGGPHAERVALESAGKRARGATLVVTLEPCRHHGKTPPCVDAIARAGIARVVFGAADVDPQARGGAVELRRCGVRVEDGVLEAAVRAQNAAFFHRHADTGRPYVALKLAMSQDGRIADASGRSRWVTGQPARDWVHWLRAGHEAIGVGLGTVRSDDPQLTVRGALRPQSPPLRVVFDRHAEMPTTALLAATAEVVPTLVLAETPGENAEALRTVGVEIGTAPGLAGALAYLAGRGVASLLVEGGGILASRLLAEGLVDRLYLITAPIFLGAGAKPAFARLPDVALEAARRWRVVGRQALGEDTLVVLDPPGGGGGEA